MPEVFDWHLSLYAAAIADPCAQNLASFPVGMDSARLTSYPARIILQMADHQSDRDHQQPPIHVCRIPQRTALVLEDLPLLFAQELFTA